MKKLSSDQEIPVYLSNSLISLSSILLQNIRKLKERRDISSYGKRYLIIVPSHEKRVWLFHHISAANSSLLDIDILLIEDFFYLLKGGKKFPSWRSSLLPAIVASFETYKEDDKARALFYKSALSLFKETEFLSQEDELCSVISSCTASIPEIFWNYIPEHTNGYLQELYVSISLFGISSLSEAILEQCMKIGSSISLSFSFYVLSPCLHFWSDIHTQKEIRWILDEIAKKEQNREKIQIYESSLSLKNELLANLGVIAREFARKIEQGPFYTIPQYSLLPDLLQKPIYSEHLIDQYVFEQQAVEKKSSSLLHMLQADMLCFITKREKKEYFSKNDLSIQCGVSSTLFQEVVALREVIQNHYSGNKEAITIGGILVLVPSLEAYKDAFIYVFHDHQPAIVQFLNRSCSGKKRDQASNNGFYTWLQTFFSFIGRKRGIGTSSELLMKCTFHPLTLYTLFREEASEKEQEFSQYLESLHLDWYISRDHMKRELYDRGVDALHEMHRLYDFSSIKREKIEEFIFQHSEDKEISLLLHREMNNAFISLTHFFEKCEELWQMPITQHSTKKIGEWISLLRETIESFDSFEESLDHDDLEIFEKISLRYYALSDRFPEVEMSFSWFSTSFLNELLKEMRSIDQLQLYGHILVAERANCDPIPCSGIAILGSSQDQFPHLSQEHFLSHLESTSPTLSHDVSAIDRNLFLNAILSSSEWLYCSAVAKSEDAITTKRDLLSPFSPLVKELIHYIDQNYISEDNQTLFSTKNILFSRYSERGRKRDTYDFERRRDSSSDLIKKKKNDITVQKLLDTAQNPYEPYFFSQFQVKASSLHVALQYKNVKKLRIKPTQYAEKRAILERLQSQKDHNGQQKEDKNKKGWPKGYIGALHSSLIEKQVDAISSRTMACKPIHAFLYDHEYQEEGVELGEKLSLPSITVSDVHKEETFFLTGKLFQFSQEKFLFYTENWESEIYKRFPEYIIRSYVYYRDGIGSQDLQLYKKEALFPIFSDREEVETTLYAWLEFTQASAETLFPFTQKVVEMLLSLSFDRNSESSRKKAVQEVALLVIRESAHQTALLPFVSLFSEEYIDNFLDMWISWAIRLYGTLAIWIEKKPFGNV